MQITKEHLHNLYINQQLSTRECAESLEISQSMVRVLMKKFGIKGRPYTKNKMPISKGSHLSKNHKKAISDHHKNDPNWHTKGKYFDKHYGWKTGIRSYRRAKLSEVPLLCNICGVGEKKFSNGKSNLIVHHIDENRENNALNNLMVLCISCHRKVHLGSLKIKV